MQEIKSFLPKDDGVTHINIYSKGSTALGRMLSNFAHTPFIFEGLEYASVEGLWYYLKTGLKYHHLRDLHGFVAKSEGKKYASEYLEGFNEKILEGIRCKLRAHRDILDLLAKSDLPLTHYYWGGDMFKPIITRLPQYEWIVDEFRRIRDLMQKKVLTVPAESV